MSFCLLNNYAVPIEDGSSTTTDTPIGDSDRTMTGALLRSTRATKRTWSVSIPPSSAALADSIRHLIRGDGDVVHFDGSGAAGTATGWDWSEKGTPGLSTVAGAGLVGGKFSRGVRVSAASTVTWTSNTGAVWTVMAWYHSGGAWHHYILRSDGAKWVDGVSSGAAIAFLANTSTTTTLGDAGAAGNQDFDDLVWLPWLLHSDMCEAFGSSAYAFSDLPHLNLRGDIHSDSGAVEVTCTAEVTGEHVQGVFGGTFTVGRAHSFELEEV